MYQTFAKVFSKFAVCSRKAESRRKLRAGLEPRATVLYGRAFLQPKKVHFLEKSRAARARMQEAKPTPLKSDFFSKNHTENEDPAKMTHSIPDLLSRDEVCARKFAVLLRERKESCAHI